MNPDRLAYKNSVIAWYRFGTGSQPVFCFHGYGEDATAFAFLDEQAPPSFSYLAIDLPFHGLTEWKETVDFTVTDLVEIVRLLLAQTTKNDTPVPRFSVLGFSLGGRIALSLTEAMPAQIEKLVLLAPDGLKVNAWYWLATQTILGNKLFAFTMKHPGWFFSLLKLLNKLRLVNASIFKFVNYYIGDPRARDLLYNRWTGLRRISPNLSTIKKDIRQHHTPVRILYGKHDRIILSSVGEKFRKGIEAECTITIINSGHQLLHHKHREEIVHALLR
jgi:pimeloyl-ACP methyl ester carboxylesterase